MKLIPQLWDWNVSATPAGWLSGSPTTTPAVWQASLPSNPATQAHLISLLSPDERARLECLQQAEDQLRFLTGRGLLRILVGAQINLPANAVEFCFGQTGKPFLSGATTLHFNIAHSGKLVLLAFSQHADVGVDVEEIRPADDLNAIVQQTFSPEEQRRWLQLKPEEKPAAFYQMWTRYEAQLKTSGSGLSAPRERPERSRRHCADLDLPAGYCGAVAWRNTSKAPSE